jgi:hypothetical protein
LVQENQQTFRVNLASRLGEHQSEESLFVMTKEFKGAIFLNMLHTPNGRLNPPSLCSGHISGLILRIGDDSQMNRYRGAYVMVSDWKKHSKKG